MFKTCVVVLYSIMFMSTVGQRDIAVKDQILLIENHERMEDLSAP